MDTKSHNLLLANELTATDIQLLIKRAGVFADKGTHKCEFTGEETRVFGFSFKRGRGIVWHWYKESEYASKRCGVTVFEYVESYNCNTGKSRRGVLNQIRITERLRQIAHKQ